MTEQWLLSAVQRPTVTFLFDRNQISCASLSDQLASLDHSNRAIVVDWHKEKIVVVCRDGRETTQIFALAEQWGWVRERPAAD